MNEELYVFIIVEDIVNRVEVKMVKAMEEVKKFFVFVVSMVDIGIFILCLFILKKYKNG